MKKRTFYSKLVLSLVLFGVCSPTFGREEEIEGSDTSKSVDAPLPASDEGEVAIKGFKVPEGWNVSLFAAEPFLANPVSLDVDNQGRVYVCETYRQSRGVDDNRAHNREWLLADLAAMSVEDRIAYHKRLTENEAKKYTEHDDLIRMLQDTDGDGKCDQQTVFANGFNNIEDGTGAGVLAHDGTVYYTCIPNLWAFKDTNGDGVADERKSLHRGYGVRVAFRGHDLHGLIVGPDGRLYFSIGDRGYNIQTPDGKLVNPESGAVFRCELDGSNLEVIATGLRNPQELAFDDYGNLFTGDNNSDSGDKARWVNVMEGGDTGWRMMYQYISDRGPFNREKIWLPYSAETPAYIVPPIANFGDGPSGLACYPGTGLTGDYQNCFFMVDFRGGANNSGLRVIRTQPKGAFWEVERQEEPVWNILLTDIVFGPDGAIWGCDWVNGWNGEGKGRIYRFLDEEAQTQPMIKEVQSLLAKGFSETELPSLQNMLGHVDRRIRLGAQWELAKRKNIEVFQSVLADSSSPAMAQLHSVWGIGHVTRLNPSFMEKAKTTLKSSIASSDREIRRAACTVIGDLGIKDLADIIVEHVSDSEPRVQYAACIAAGKLGLEQSAEPVVEMLASNADADPALRHAGIMALTGLKPETIAGLSKNESTNVRVAAVVALRKLASPLISEFLVDNDVSVKKEAARAINDVVALHSELPKLAALVTTKLTDDALAHRVLNANFRLGKDENAALIAAFAANSSNSEAMRIEAIEMLATWGSPGKLDRVMNRFIPLEDRDSQIAVTSFEQNLAGIFVGSGKVIKAAITATGKLEIKSTNDLLRSIALDRSREASVRSDALLALTSIQKSAVQPLAEQLTGDGSPAVRAQAVETLAKFAPEKAIPVLKKAIGSEDIEERQSAWDVLASLKLDQAKEIVEEGLKRVMNNDVAAAEWLNIVESADKVASADAVKAYSEFKTSLTATDPIAEYRESLEGGDVASGETIFKTKTELSCLRCHKVGIDGGNVGPNLTEIAKTRDSRYLLESIVNPDAQLAENFKTVIVVTDDDQILTGILKQETDEWLELMDAEGKLIRIEKELIVQTKEGKSSMPTDLIKFMSRRELRDLVAFLHALDGSDNSPLANDPLVKRNRELQKTQSNY